MHQNKNGAGENAGITTGIADGLCLRLRETERGENLTERFISDVVFISRILTVLKIIWKIHELTKTLTYLKSLLLLRP